jgi:hypothetical protein
MPGSLLSVEALRLTKFLQLSLTLMEASSANSGGLRAIRKSTDAIRPWRKLRRLFAPQSEVVCCGEGVLSVMAIYRQLNPSGQIANEFHKPKSRLTIWLAQRILTPQIAWILARDRFRASSQDHYSRCSASFPFAVAASNQTT